MLHKKRITFTVIRFFVLRQQLRFRDQNNDSGSGGGKAPTTAGGGNFVGAFLMRNERSVQRTVATIEHAEQEFESLMLHKKRITFTEIRFFVPRQQLWYLQ